MVMVITSNHPLLRRLQRSKSLTAVSVIGYFLIPLSIMAYALYTWNDPLSRAVSNDSGGYPELSQPVAYTPPESQTTVQKPLSKPKPQSVQPEPPKPAPSPQNEPVQVASTHEKKDKKDHEDKPEDPIKPNDLLEEDKPVPSNEPVQHENLPEDHPAQEEPLAPEDAITL